MILPEKLVAVFTPNRQSLSGVLDLAARAIEYRRTSADLRPMAVFPLPSRIEDAEHELKRRWRANYQREFEETFLRIYQGRGVLPDARTSTRSNSPTRVTSPMASGSPCSRSATRRLPPPGL